MYFCSSTLAFSFMKRLCSVLFTYSLCLLATQLLAQTGSITGQISADGQGLPFATVLVEGTSLGVAANAEGQFTIRQIPTGTYTLKVSAVGYQPLAQQVTVTPGNQQQLNITLITDRLNLNEVVVSGTRYNLSRKESPVVVNVLNAKVFEASQAMALSEGLNFQPGVRVETNCQNCGFTQVRLNGLEGAYSQILVNSRPVFSALNGVYGLDQIPTNMVERVEVVRGGGSALYGSNAIGGTINIITKDPTENTWQAGSSLGLIDGTALDHTVNYNASLVSNDLSRGITLYGLLRNRESYDANADGFTEITELENNTIGIKAYLEPTSFSKLIADFSVIQEYRRGGNQLELPPHLTDITERLDHNTLIGGLTYEQYSRDNHNKYVVYTSGQYTERDSYYGGLGGARTAQDSTTALNAYGNTYALAWVTGAHFTRHPGGASTLTGGIEHQLSDVSDQIPGYDRVIDQQVNTLGLFGQWEWQPTRKLKTLVGGRFDHTTVNGQYQVGQVQRQADVTLNVFSPRLTVMYTLNQQLQFRGGYARGFRAPQAFNEDLHISSVGGEPQFVILGIGLDKEVSDTYTASVSYDRNIKGMQASVLLEGFHTTLRNPFTIVSTGAVLPNGSILEEVRNGDGAYVQGINLEASIAPTTSLILQAGGTLQQSVYRQGQVLFEPETPTEAEPPIVVDRFMRTPNLYGYLTANWQPGNRFETNLTSTYTGSMTVPRVVSESGFLNLVQSSAFYDLNLKLTYHIEAGKNLHLSLSGGVQNLFNSFQNDFDSGPTRDSDFVYGPARPRTLFVGVKIGNSH